VAVNHKDVGSIPILGVWEGNLMVRMSVFKTVYASSTLALLDLKKGKRKGKSSYSYEKKNIFSLI
jgi:hypothetical protein